MLPAQRKIPTTLAMVVGLLVLLALLAVLQYRWLSQVSDAAQERMQTTLVSSLSRFVEDFDREIARSFVYFRSAPSSTGLTEGQQLTERLQLWHEEAPYPALIENVYLARPDETGNLRWVRVQPASEPQPVGEADASRLWMELRSSLGRRPRGLETPMPFFVIEQIPAVAFPLPFEPDRPRREMPRPGNRRGRPRPPERQPGAIVVLELNRSFLQEEWLPALMRRYFAPSGDLDFDVVVFAAHDRDAVLYQSNPEARFVTGDASANLFGSVSRDELRHLWLQTRPGLEGFARPPELEPGAPPPRTGDNLTPNESGPWQIVVRHRAGSLEAAVSALRLRNLVISLGVLVLLATSMAMILVSTQRAQQLAKQQMEFVAGVTHELQTPLAVIRSAGQNLADGVVEGAQPVKEYGSLIEKEGRRLSDMVSQVLEFAGFQSRSALSENVAVAVEEVIDTALAGSQLALSEGGIEVEKNLESDLPLLQGDPAALGRALQNLIENAAKYGGEGKWIGIGARRDKDAVVITVSDRGPGIPPVDLPHVFEPFYRGRHTRSGVAQEVRGNGLGLSLVQQIVEKHGGRVSVQSAPKGTVFTIQLPARATATH